MSLISTSKKRSVYFNETGDKYNVIARGQYSYIIETACLSCCVFEADNSPYGVYATRHWNWMNSCWMCWIGRVRGARSKCSVCDFRKITFRDLTVHESCYDARKSCVFQIPLVSSIIPYPCPRIIRFMTVFDGVDFSEHCPEQVISFFWRSM